MNTFHKCLLATALSLTSGAALAADSYKIDPAHVWVTFSIQHAAWANAHGLFRTVEGEIVFDKDDVSKSSVNARIDASSISTNFEKRDADMRSPDFLNTLEFPTITFESTNIEKTGDATGKMTGDLTMIGVTVPVTLDVSWSGNEMAFPWAKDIPRTAFSASGVINPADFGMAKVGAFGLGPTISVQIDLEAEQR